MVVNAWKYGLTFISVSIRPLIRLQKSDNELLTHTYTHNQISKGKIFVFSVILFSGAGWH